MSGDSRTGKSSRLEADALPGGGACAAVRMVPGQGAHPFDALARVVNVRAESVRLGLRVYSIRAAASWRRERPLHVRPERPVSIVDPSLIVKVLALRK